MEKLAKTPRGFTLLEAAVVLVLTAVVGALAVPTFNTVVENSRERTAQASAERYVSAVRAFAVSANPTGSRTLQNTPQAWVDAARGLPAGTYIEGVPAPLPASATVTDLDGTGPATAGLPVTAGSLSAPVAFALSVSGTLYPVEISVTGNDVSFGTGGEAPEPVASAPSAPTGVTATSTSTSSVSVAFTAGAANGSTVSGFSVTCTSTDGGSPGTSTGPSSPVVVSALTPGKTYACTVAAQSNMGASPASNASTPVQLLEDLALSYATTAFTRGSNSQQLAAATSGGSGAKTFAVSGTLPTGVVFNEENGTFTGPASSGWNFTATAVTGGGSHTCALASTGVVYCWGDNTYGQVHGTTVSVPTTNSSPVQVPNLTGVTQLDAGEFHTCARLSNGTVRCWGRNNFGQLAGSSTSTAVANLSGVSQVSAGYAHTCALKTDGTIRCWGDDFLKQLGNSSVTEPVQNVTTAVAIDAGGYFTCALLNNARVICWGANNAGQLGNSSLQYGDTVMNLTNVTQVSVGYEHACARRSDATVRCWGSNSVGQTGTGSGTTQEPLPLAGSPVPSDVAQVSAGHLHTCIAFADGTGKCWGRGANGRLGNGATSDRSVPTEFVTGLTGASSVSASGGASSCAVVTGGLVRCWGSTSSGRLGNGVTSGNQTTPVSTLLTGPQPGFPAPLTVTVTDSTGSASANVTLSVS